ncbi:STAS domain-containing protein [Acaryochloris sp. CCMEE 5410]|uniref:STAS domain-containing protein n=1 Tax=Acaryochloris sp. CCMEE 5410 TaxID=310037 RepID=UPI0002483A99|nr:STAS domain-containing protein [Acaryochloris sp. CCMEE 5410]KAI9130894.1 STAS domain-containing protein [Acaryochloris sp. CCMEE 5410]
MRPNVTTIQPNNILDGVTGAVFRQEVAAAVEAGADIVLVDCQDISFMDSSGLGALVLALKFMRAAERQLVLCSLNQQVKTLFQLTEIAQVFQIYDNRQHFEQSGLLGS